jgi:hypothetical protein
MTERAEKTMAVTMPLLAKPNMASLRLQALHMTQKATKDATPQTKEKAASKSMYSSLALGVNFEKGFGRNSREKTSSKLASLINK